MSAAPHLEPVRDRDYLREMREVIEAETASGEYVSALVAAHIVAKLKVTDPDLLDGWLAAGAVGFIRHAINLRDCASRTTARHNAKRLAFGEAANRFEQGDRDALTSFLTTVYPTEDGTRKRLSEMVASDLEFVATDYEHRANEHAMSAAFLRALRKKVGRKRVGEVFSEAQVAQMWRSLSGG